MPAALFADGWSLKFDRFLVSVGELGATSRAARLSSPGYRIYDLARPSAGQGHSLARLPAPPGAYEHFLYTIAPASEATAGNATAADVALMNQARASVRILATATRGAETKRLDLAFAPTLVHDCAITSALAPAARLDLRATLHVDHLVMDNTADSSLRLQLLLDADGKDGSSPDGTITAAELAATDISAHPQYRVRTARDLSGAPIRNLRQYLERRIATLGHVDGENPCTITATI